MSNVLTMSKKAITWGVVVTAILWSMSAAFVVAPLTAKAATALAAGDLIRGTVKSPYGGYPVFFYTTDGKKSLFPNEVTYKSWYSDFSAVKVLPQTELEAIPSGDKNVTVRPGSSVVKFENESGLYVLEKGGMIRSVTDAVAKELYGASYVPAFIQVAFRANYTSGSAVASASDYNKSTAMASAPDISTNMGNPAVVTPTGSISVSLASDNPAGAVLPMGATSVALMKVAFNGGASGANITALSFKRIGIGSVNDFSNVYVYDGSMRVTSGRTISSQSQAAEFSNLSIAVGAGTTKTLTLVGDVAASGTATSGDTHAFALVSVGTTASVAGLPVQGSTVSIGSQSVTTVTLERGTDPSNPTIGQKEVPIGEFKLTGGTNDQELRWVTVTVGGTVSLGDLSNLGLYQANTKIATGTVSSDRVTFILDAPYQLPQGASRFFTIKADVGGRGSRTIVTYVDSTYPSDLGVFDKVYGYGAKVTFTTFGSARTGSTSCDSASSTQGSCVTTQGGKVTVAFNGPAASDISKGAQDAVLYRFSITAADQAVEVRKLGLTIAGSDGGYVRGSSGTKYFTDIKVKNSATGAVLMGPKEHGASSSATTTGATPCASSGTLCYTDAWVVPAGQTVNLAVTADIASSEDAGADEFFGEGYKVTLEGFSTTSVREVSTGQYLAVADIVGGGAAVQGNTMTVRESGLTVSLASTPNSQVTVKGTQGISMMGLAFAAGASSDVKVTQLVFAGEGNDTSSAFAGDGSGYVDDLILSASIWDGSTQIGTAKSPTSAGTITFDNLNWTIPAGQTKLVTLKVNVATTLLAGSVDYVYLGLPVANVTSYDKDSNTISAAAGSTSPTNTDGASNFLTVNSAGTLKPAVDGDTPLASLVVSNTNDVVIGKFKFTAANESFSIRKLRVINTSAASGTTDSSTADDMVRLVKLSYKKQDGSTATASAVMSGAVADFSGLEAYVPVSGDAIITVMMDVADLNSVSGRSAVEIVRVGLDFGIAGDTNFEAVGLGSSTTFTLGSELTTGGSGFTNDTDAKDGDVMGNAFYVVKSKPTVTLAAASPYGAGTPGLNEVLRFTVAADASGDVVLDALTFAVSSTDNAGTPTGWNVEGDASGDLDLTSSWSLYNANDLTTQLEGGDSDWTLYATTGAAAASSGLKIGYARLVLTTPINISAGTSKTFVLKVDTTGASSSADDTVRFDVLAEGGAPAASTLIGLNEFQWDETGANAVSNIDGTLVKNLPVQGGTIIY